MVRTRRLTGAAYHGSRIMTNLASSTSTRSRGMRDLLPADMRAFRRVEDAFRAAASRWGYEEIRTPTIETYSLFTAAGALTAQMLSRVYSFLDWDGWSGERVVLLDPLFRFAVVAWPGAIAKQQYCPLA